MMPANLLARSVSRATTAMLGLTFRPAIRAVRPVPWRTAIVEIPGARPVTVALSSDRGGCATLAAAMLGMHHDDLDPAMIDDFLRELVHLTARHLKGELAPAQALGVPRVLDGEAMFERPGSWTHYVLAANSIHLVVSLGNARDPQRGAVTR